MCDQCRALMARVDQLEAGLDALHASAVEWRREAIEATLRLMERDGEVEQRPDGRWGLTEAGLALPSVWGKP